MLNANRFTSRVNFVGNNEIITASRIQKFSTGVTMSELSTNNGLILSLDKKTFNSKNRAKLKAESQRYRNTKN